MKEDGYATDPEQQAVLDGQKGETLAKVMKTIVMYGDIFGAEKLVPVTHPEGHFVTSFGISLMKPLFATMDELIRANVHTIGKFTVDPRPLDYQNVKCNPVEKLVFAVMYGKQEEYEQQLMQVGLRDRKAFTCTAYLPEVRNVPRRETSFRGRRAAPSCMRTPSWARAATATAA